MEVSWFCLCCVFINSSSTRTTTGVNLLLEVSHCWCCCPCCVFINSSLNQDYHKRKSAVGGESLLVLLSMLCLHQLQFNQDYHLYKDVVKGIIVGVVVHVMSSPTAVSTMMTTCIKAAVEGKPSHQLMCHHLQVVEAVICIGVVLFTSTTLVQPVMRSCASSGSTP